jgi:hypothetical protein
MPGMSVKSFGQPDETRTPPMTTVEVVRLEGGTMARMTFQPGWRWSQHIKPVVGTDSCQVRHRGVLVSGTIHVVHADGTEGDANAGDAYVIEPGQACPGTRGPTRKRACARATLTSIG